MTGFSHLERGVSPESVQFTAQSYPGQGMGLGSWGGPSVTLSCRDGVEWLQGGGHDSQSSQAENQSGERGGRASQSSGELISACGGGKGWRPGPRGLGGGGWGLCLSLPRCSAQLLSFTCWKWKRTQKKHAWRSFRLRPRGGVVTSQ